jgi:hypothetical protein
MMQVADSHICQCQHCGKRMAVTSITFTPSPLPPECQHEWAGVSIWKATDGDHGSRRCLKCGQYQQW